MKCKWDDKNDLNGLYIQDFATESENPWTDNVRTPQRQQREEKEPYLFYNDDRDNDVNGDSEGEEEDEERTEEGDYEETMNIDDGQIDAYPTEMERRREQRQKQAAREREGERRRRAGLPRNYLLIDENTKEPYG